jgi:hypothetical protein
MIDKKRSFRRTVRVPSDCLCTTGLSSPHNEGLNEDSTTWFKSDVAAEDLKQNGDRHIICVLVCDEQLQAALSEANLKLDALLKHSSNGHFLGLEHFEKESPRVLQGRDLMKGGDANIMLLYYESYERERGTSPKEDASPKEEALAGNKLKDASPKEEALTSVPLNTPPRREHDRRNSEIDHMIPLIITPSVARTLPY